MKKKCVKYHMRRKSQYAGDTPKIVHSEDKKLSNTFSPFTAEFYFSDFILFCRSCFNKVRYRRPVFRLFKCPSVRISVHNLRRP